MQQDGVVVLGNGRFVWVSNTYCYARAMSLLIINAENRSLSLRVLGFVNFLLSSATFIFSLCGFIFIYPVWVVWTCVLYFCVGLNGVGVILFLSLIRVDGVYILFFLFSFSFFLSSSWFPLSFEVSYC